MTGMRRLQWWLVLLLVSGCNCQPELTPDPTTPPSLTWPEGARLEVTATTQSSADLRWPEALGLVASYRLTWPGSSRDEAGTTTSLTGLPPGEHLPVEVVAVAADGTTSPPLKAEVAAAKKLEVPEGDISTDFCGANVFLAVGVAIPCATMSVVTGHVRTRDGGGVPGLTVSILEHPEWGSATTQADGLYALAVAAGRMTLHVQASAFLPIQRSVMATAREFTTVPDTVVLRRDEKATAISTAAGGFHVGTPQEDKDGRRSTAVFIPPGTSAVLRLADGGTTPAPTLTLRATEATVGPRGQEAMPATLPAATAYTFAADISADEGLAVGATGVGFTDSVAMYADNFQKFEVGVAIPLGAYDTRTGTWESLPDARVVQVAAGGRLDLTGDGEADEALPMLAGEAAALAAHYAVGTQLVRSLTKHFSTLDANTAWRCVGTCQALGEAAASGHSPWCDGECGSLVRVQNRTVSEFVGVAGTGLTLSWHSHRTQARRPAVDFRMGKSRDGGLPEGTKGTSYVLEVAGQRLLGGSSDGGYGDTAAVTWNGVDVFGRPVRGTVPATASTGYGLGACPSRWGEGEAASSVSIPLAAFQPTG
jgi:hypothetical protein